MNAYRVQHDFAKYQPKWTGDYPRKFGAGNEGFIVHAADETQARDILRNDHNLNPFYVKLTPIQGGK